MYNLEFPTEEALRTIKGLILPGSYHSVYHSHVTQIEPFKRFIRKIYYEYPHIKMVGICFGHQIIAEALGGKVTNMSPERSPNGLYTGKENLTISESFLKLPSVEEALRSVVLDEDINLLKTLTDKKELNVIAVHRDHAMTLPEEAVLHASSSRTDVEIYSVRD